MQRILNRLICEKCQWSESQILFKDKKLICSMSGGNLIKHNADKEETIKYRLKLYNENEKAILDAYQKAGIKISYINVENKNPQQVFAEFKEFFLQNRLIIHFSRDNAPYTTLRIFHISILLGIKCTCK